MLTYSVLVLFFLTTVDSRNLEIRHKWHKLVDKITNKYDVDNRHFNQQGMLLFPDVAFQSFDDNQTDTWKVVVHGWKYRSNARKDWFGFSASLWIERLAKNIMNKNDVLYLNGSINRDRLRPFFVSDLQDKTITIKIGDEQQVLHTDHSGQFYEQIQISDKTIQQQRNGGQLIYTAIEDDDDERNSTGLVRLIDPSHGLSIISDIDDTIKISEVLDKVRLIANTFIYPFKPVPGKFKSKYLSIESLFFFF